MEYSVVFLLVFHFPIGLGGDVDIYLRTGGTKQCQATIKRAIRPIVDYASPYLVVKILPLSQHSQKFSIMILGLTVNVGMMFRLIRQLTGTLDGNALFVIRLILLMKFIAAVLHSRESIRKWSRTSNVNAVLGFFQLAGKSLARRRSWAYWRGDLAPWHHRIECVKIPVDDTMIRVDHGPVCCVDSESSKGWCSYSNSSDLSEISRMGKSISVLWGIDGQLSG